MLKPQCIKFWMTNTSSNLRHRPDDIKKQKRIQDLDESQWPPEVYEQYEQTIPDPPSPSCLITQVVLQSLKQPSSNCSPS
ncbi:hypothetical protein DM01DRAFT_1377543 [Hesseltinella vesiculosa]|uniref:Uncharacterized protein n=1 Tax=Hesseltinella vesiculosa TaxID=101127 RepID=A0A1X2G743_9FUNG|nr:hypothetical protein DM01DRAFT_1377543 [Hesseltinella vesiculosa]